MLVNTDRQTYGLGVTSVRQSFVGVQAHQQRGNNGSSKKIYDHGTCRIKTKCRMLVINRQTDLWIRGLTDRLMNQGSNPPHLLSHPSYRVPRPSVNHSWVCRHIKNVETTATL